ncbi:PAS domain-containing protein [Methylobacterium iners]|uniref:PAS domain-containing protein n=1 Tax=Methylobacterium iners TaxID=418707 RepID=A0ABQ4S4B4_9HYPH|nr:PAS domain-containing protein [Methylobacterium iners]GJD97970.1 hypothetical protein OCOJLMKI_5209 [Methylobacterium iners]
MYADTPETFPAPGFDWNDEPSCAEVFGHVDAAIYTTDAEGWLTYYNEAAAALWGYRPELGRTRWCGSWRIYQLDGTPLPLDQCPMAEAMQQGQEVRGARAVLEQPDGTLIPFMPFPTPLRDASGQVVAGSNLLLPLQTPAPLASSNQLDEEPDAISPFAFEAALDPDRLTGCMQWALAALADVELAYQLDCERLAKWTGPKAERDRILRQVEHRRRRQRQPLQELLDELDRCFSATVASRLTACVQSVTSRQALA